MKCNIFIFLYLFFVSTASQAQSEIVNNIDRHIILMDNGKNPLYSINNIINGISVVKNKAIYINFSDFKNGFALVQDSLQRIGLINAAGEIVFPCEYSNISICENGLFLLRSIKGDTFSLVTKKNQTIVPFGKYNNYSRPQVRMLIGKCGNDAEYDLKRRLYFETIPFQKYIGVQKEKKWTVINADGKEIFPAKFNWIGIFKGILAPIDIAGKGDDIWTPIDNNQKFGVIDTLGNVIVPTIYDNVKIISENSIIVTDKKKMGVLNAANKLLIPFLYKSVDSISNNTFIVDSSDVDWSRKYGIVNVENQIVITAEYNEINKFGTGYLVKDVNLGIAVFDENGVRKTDFSKNSLFYYPLWQFSREIAYLYHKETNEYLRYGETHVVKINNTISGFIFRDKNKFGLIDSTGKEVMKPQFDKFHIIYNKNTIIVENGNKWGVVKTNGETPLPFEYDYIEYGANIYNSNKGFFLLKKDGKYGLADNNLTIVISPKYDEIILKPNILNASNTVEFITVKNSGKWGLIDAFGKEITLIQYDSPPVMVRDFYTVYINKKAGLINKDGIEIAPCIYDYIKPDLNLIMTIRSNLYGLIDYKGKIIIPNIYNDIRHDLLNQNWIYITSWQDKKGILNSFGKEILPFLFNEVEFISFQDRKVLLKVSNKGKFGVSDFSGKIIVPLLYQKIEAYDRVFLKEKYLFKATLNGKEGVLNQFGKVIIPFQYEEIGKLDNKYISVKKDREYGLINWSNQKMLPFNFDELIEGAGSYYIFKENDQYGLMDLMLKKIIPALYDNIHAGPQHTFIIYKNGKVGLLNKVGKVIAEPIYDTYSTCGKEKILFIKNNLMGLMEYTGKVIYPCEYTQIDCEDGKVVEVYK